MDRILVTGGAGFVGAQTALELARRHPHAEVLAFDNLSRRGRSAADVAEIVARLARAELGVVRRS